LASSAATAPAFIYAFHLSPVDGELCLFAGLRQNAISRRGHRFYRGVDSGEPDVQAVFLYANEKTLVNQVVGNNVGLGF
jgi:hypothetical protein